MIMSKNYYDILGVSKTATSDEIKKSYRKLSKIYHPDVKETGNEEKFKNISEAHEVLTDKTKRTNFDKYGDAKGPKPEDLRSQFSSAFHGSFNVPVSRGDSIQTFVSLTLEEMKIGVNKKIKYVKNITCSSCQGNGSKHGKSFSTCSLCLGIGILQRRVGGFQIPVRCHHCGGHGRFVTEECDKCHSVGTEQIDMEVEMAISPGAFDGYTVRVQGYGHDSNDENGYPGDLHIIIQQEAHKYFERNGDDIVYKLNLSLPDMILGAKVEIPTLEGKIVFDVPETTPHGKTFRIKGKGMPSIPKKGIIGDLMVVAFASIPESVNSEEKNILENLRKSNNFISKNTYKN